MTQYAAEPKAVESKPQGPMAMCPMATVCMKMAEKRRSGYLLMFAGAILVAIGVLIVVEPRILVWLIAAAFVLVGVMLFMMAGFIHRMGAQPHV